MRKVFCILAGLTLIGLLAACDLSSYFKPKTAQPPTSEATPPAAPTSADTTTPPPPPEPPAATEPAPEHRRTHSNTENPPPSARTEPPPYTGNQGQVGETTTVPPPKVKKAGLGVIFEGNLEQGQFRVKCDNNLIYDLAFSGKDTRAAKELFVEPGQHLMKFVVIDARGVRGIKEETMNFLSGRHQTLRVSVKDTPGAIIVEHLE